MRGCNIMQTNLNMYTLIYVSAMLICVSAFILFVVSLVITALREKKPSKNAPREMTEYEKFSVVRQTKIVFATAEEYRAVTEPRPDNVIPIVWCFVRTDDHGIWVKKYERQCLFPEEHIPWLDIERRKLRLQEESFIERGRHKRWP